MTKAQIKKSDVATARCIARCIVNTALQNGSTINLSKFAGELMLTLDRLEAGGQEFSAGLLGIVCDEIDNYTAACDLNMSIGE
jgi:hypothetical protein